MVSFSARQISGSRQCNAWDVLADIKAFIFAAKAELTVMDTERAGVIAEVANRILSCSVACGG